MLVKCETKSSRVKGLSFHPKLSWVLVSLHKGVIQLWDFRIGSLIDQYEEHDGPVRGVDFHSSQPIFVSGGDDNKIKVWNYNQRRCIFTLLGHLDYIRTVQFHPEYPWILSASDDQTVRIWNWQNRSCISVLAGHNHYVMSAQFHPKQDLLISASLDQTVRVWDISGLRERTYSIRGGTGGSGPRYDGGNSGVGGGNSLVGSSGGGGASGAAGASLLILSAQQADMFGASDAVCKFILEGHDRGVNWATFHPTIPLIASGADDRFVKLWRYNESKWWEVETFRGHFNNVSCVLFHPTRDLLLSNSEDRTIRVWDITKRVLVHTFRRENDRFWILAAVANSNTLGVGHDSGTVVFKLDRERTPAHTVGQKIFYVKDRWVSVSNCVTGASTALVACRRPTNAMCSGIRALTVNNLNQSDVNVLVFYKEPDSGAYDLLTFPSVDAVIASPGCVVTRQGVGIDVVFVARNRFAVLETAGSLAVYNMNHELTKRLELPVAVDRLLYAGSNRLLLKSEELVYLYDLSAKKLLAEVSCPGGVRYAVWSENGQYVALICKHHIILANSKLDFLCSFYENIRVKGGAWDPLDAFVYTTLSHIKYCLPNGDHGIIRCLPQPLYIMKVEQQKVWALDRKGQGVSCFPLNCTEYLFKLALHLKQFNQVAVLIRNGRLCGNAIVSYLRKKEYANVALQFVSDLKTRFTLALEDGNLDEASRTAGELDEKSCWQRLGVEAMRHGDFRVAETVYQNIKDFDKLSFLYLVSGNTHKLRKMLKIAERRKDSQARLNNALLLGDVEERIRVLASVGQLPLAALIAKVYKLDDISKALDDAVEGLDLDAVLCGSNGTCLSLPLSPPAPLTAIQPEEAAQRIPNWPKLQITESPFTFAMVQTEKLAPEALAVLQSRFGTAANLGKDASKEASLVDQGFHDASDLVEDVTDTGAWGDFDEMDDMGLGIPKEAESGEWDKKNGHALIEYSDEGEGDHVDDVGVHLGEKPMLLWCKGQTRISHYVAAGKYEDALDYLAKRIGLINPAPLQAVFKSIVRSSFSSLPLLPLFPSKYLPLLESGTLVTQDHRPISCVSVSSLLENLREGNRLVTAGKLEEALSAYTQLLHRLAFAEAESEEEERQLLEILTTARIYALAMRIECTRQSLSESEVLRNVELAAYLGCSKLQPVHQFLALRRALTVAWKAQNYITAATFAQKLIQANFGPNVKGLSEAVTQAKKVLIASEKRGFDQYAIDFDVTDTDSLAICSSSLSRILPRDATVKCPYCSSIAKAAHAGELCSVCTLSELGARVLGLQFRVFS